MRQLRDAAVDHIAHTARYRALDDIEVGICLLGAQEPYELGQIEGVSGGPLHKQVNNVVGRGRADLALEIVSHRIARETAELDPTSGTGPRQRDERGRELRISRSVTHGEHQQERSTGKSGQQELHDVVRRRVSPLHVVEYDDQRPLANTHATARPRPLSYARPRAA